VRARRAHTSTSSRASMDELPLLNVPAYHALGPGVPEMLLPAGLQWQAGQRRDGTGKVRYRAVATPL
jgi:hypothetical protein